MNPKPTRRSPPRPAHRRLGSGLLLAAAYLAGCGRSAEVRGLPEAARAALARKKMDVQPRSPKSPRPGASPSAGSPAGRRP